MGGDDTNKNSKKNADRFLGVTTIVTLGVTIVE
jgi:hypothetical protein